MNIQFDQAFVLSSLNKVEYLVQYFIGNTQNQLVQTLAIFQIIKLYFRLRKLKKQIYLDNQEEGRQEILIPQTFLQKNIQNQEQQKQAQQRIKLKLNNIKTKKIEYHKQGQETLEKCGKTISLDGVQMINKSLKKQIFSKRVLFSQMLFLIRPIIYALSIRSVVLIRIYGSTSWMPYFISISIDLIRLILIKEIKFNSQIEKQNLIARNKQMIFNYIFRNPFYKSISKPLLIDPILNKIFSQGNLILRLINYFLQVRTSLTLVL